MGQDLKAITDELFKVEHAPGLPAVRGSDENGALRQAISAANHWFEAYKIAQKELIDTEDERAEIAAAHADILRLRNRTRLASLVAGGAAFVTMALALWNMSGL